MMQSSIKIGISLLIVVIVMANIYHQNFFPDKKEMSFEMENFFTYESRIDSVEKSHIRQLKSYSENASNYIDREVERMMIDNKGEKEIVKRIGILVDSFNVEISSKEEFLDSILFAKEELFYNQYKEE
jgi:hypothetical protein